ncbi:Diguanylate cyclase (GGDEF) domain-containing protein [Sterolibacterium denitrificans]|uniref:Diguanylate cyclase (GGDEF) domain-containing protein n=1 Tax=Sterolibacterium denitrificans TaxID=157592 RepID=A0A7Z7HR26_9PROT|nr:bifunctional diguanylate cyclase/phosphodiesterase [Sterolibacterium denitrificans]SMB26556.1 Diguanylate cyclase (GGDEF) domain-containing protein [Sterolibacterium denitrificans]
MNKRLDQMTVYDELRKTMLEQRAIFDNVTVGVLFSRNRTVVACNALCAATLGYPEDELIGLPGIALYPSEEAYRLMARKAVPILAAGQPFHDEIEYRRKDGTTFWARTSAKAIDPQHPPNGTIWIIADITEERRVREELAQKTHELEAVFETSFVGIAVLYEERILRCNQHYAELIGHTVEEIIGQNMRMQYLSEADYAACQATFHANLQHGNEYQLEHRLCRKDGSSFWARLSARAFDPARPDEGTVWMIEDITDRKNAEEQVHAALAEQQLIFNNAAVGMVFVRNRIISRCNRKFEELFGYAEGELINNSMLILYPTLRDYDEDGLAVLDPLQRGETATSERVMRRKDGSLIWLRATGHRANTPGPGLDVIWIYEDVTERHQAEDALLRAHDELEQRVIERTSELARTNTQLQAEIYERLQAEQRIWHIAHHDALTGLPNRSLLLDRLDQALTQAARSQQRVAIMFLDLDRFKSINDTLGHHVGDMLLKHVAERLRESVRAVDTVSRLGGDEFVVVLHEIQTTEDAVMVAEKILSTLATAVAIEGHILYATPSIGISIYPDDGSETYALMKNADTAMYHAKENGRNTFQLFTSQMNDETNRIFTLEQRLRHALEQKHFVLYYQPLFDHGNDSVCGMEALVRWNDPEHGLIPPQEFIPVAEEIGLILPLGEWILREACRQSMAWQKQGLPALRISVNLSARQFRQKGLISMVQGILEETGMSANLLELEITESSLMHDADETLVKLRQLTEMGITLAIDDFGTGYSSLSYLKKFSVSRLKIDRDFVRDLCDDQDDAAIVSTIVAMASHLGLHTMAEGVETDAQLQALLDVGCRQFQGNLFSQPLPAAEVASLFDKPLNPSDHP